MDRRTGWRWRRKTGGMVPREKPAASGRYLQLADRLAIADLHRAGCGVRSIVAQLGRAPSTVSRELRRNGSPSRPQAQSSAAMTTAGYAPYAAQDRAELRARRPKASKFDNAELADLVQAKLCLKWSPEQISDHLAAELPDRQELQVSPETIYHASTSRAAGICAPTCTDTCGPAVRSGARGGPRTPAGPAGSPT